MNPAETIARLHAESIIKNGAKAVIIGVVADDGSTYFLHQSIQSESREAQLNSLIKSGLTEMTEGWKAVPRSAT